MTGSSKARAMALALACALALGGCFGRGAKEPEQPKEGGVVVKDVAEGGEEEVDHRQDAPANPDDEGDPTGKEELEAGAEELLATIEDEQESLRSEAEGRGLIVLSGTLTMMSGAELGNLESVDAGAAANDLFAVLVMDEEQTVTGDGYVSDHVVLGVTTADGSSASADEWWDVDGARVCVACPSDGYASDSVPTVPRLYGSELLYVE